MDKRQIRLTQKQIQRILDLHTAGMNYGQIAERMGVSKTTVGRWVLHSKRPEKKARAERLKKQKHISTVCRFCDKGMKVKLPVDRDTYFDQWFWKKNATCGGCKMSFHLCDLVSLEEFRWTLDLGGKWQRETEEEDIESETE